jgi:integrase
MAAIERRVSRDGTITHRAKVRLKGFPPQTASFPRRTDAARWVQSTEAGLREGRYFPHAQAKRLTLGALLDRYGQQVVPLKPKNAHNLRLHLKWWAAQIGSLTLAQVTPAVITECRDRLLAGKTPNGGPRSPATVVRYLATLSHAFTVAVKEWQWANDNPVRKVSKPKEPRGRVRWLSAPERTALLAACAKSRSPLLLTIVVLAISTGMRRGEILSLRWTQVDLVRQQITLEETKNGDRASIPLKGHALALMRELYGRRGNDADHAFPGFCPGKPIDITKAWETALREAQVTNFRFHDLRHCTASYLAEGGASLMEIAAVLRHKTLQMVKRYSHIGESHVSGLVSSMNKKVFENG